MLVQKYANSNFSYSILVKCFGLIQRLMTTKANKNFKMLGSKLHFLKYALLIHMKLANLQSLNRSFTSIFNSTYIDN